MKKEMFDGLDSQHYYLGEKRLLRVTELLSRHGLAPRYTDVQEEILERARKRGNEIHSGVELFFNLGEKTDNAEALSVISLVQQFADGRKVLCEQWFADDIVAGTVDIMVDREDMVDIVDIKCVANLDKDYVAWQTSLYAYLLGVNGISVGKTYCIHFPKGGEPRLLELHRKTTEDIERLFSAEALGLLYEPLSTALKIGTNILSEIEQAQSIIETCEKQAKQARERQAGMREALKAAMLAQGIYKWETGAMQISLVDGYTKSQFDAKAFAEDHPTLYKKYTKKTEVLPSLRISLKRFSGKGEQNNDKL